MYIQTLFDTPQSLEGFVTRYQPKSWCEPIGSCCHTRYWTDAEYQDVKSGLYDKHNLTWYEREAVDAFFKELIEQHKL